MRDISQKTKKDWEEKRLVKDIKIYPEKKKIKSNNMVKNDIKISPKIKKKGWLSTEKHIIK